MYQVYPRSFWDANGDGIGDLAGVIERLDYLAHELGVDGIWLSPFYPSPMADFGYDVSDYLDIHPIFGDLATFDALVAEAHARELKIIVDFVPNHTSSEHPWFVESRSARNSAKQHWYVWADANPDGGPPNNWLSVFGGSAWEWDAATGQYYLHSFLKEQPDLNWRDEEVRGAMLDVLRFWLDRGVDGFRIDAANFVMKDPDLRDNPPNPTPPLLGAASGEYNGQLHIHDKGHPDIHTVFRDIRTALDAHGDRASPVSIGEVDDLDWEIWASYYGAQLDELHMPFNFALLTCPWNAAAVRTVVERVEAAVPAGGWPNYMVGNHDAHRIASRVGPEGARIAMMLLLTLRGTPTMYYGDEIGMHDVSIPPDLVHDPFEKQVPGFGRDPERTPMQWNAGPNAGFCPPSVTPWLPIADDYREVNVAVERDDPRSMLSLTKILIRLRRATPALQVGTYRSVNEAQADCFLYLREVAGTRWLIALNFSDREQRATFPETGTGYMALSTYLDREGEVELRSLHLRPNEGCIISLR